MALCMLIKVDDEILIGENIRIRAYIDSRNKVRVAIDAPKEIRISRIPAKRLKASKP